MTVHAKTTIMGCVSLNKECMYKKDKQYRNTHFINHHPRTKISNIIKLIKFLVIIYQNLHGLSKLVIFLEIKVGIYFLTCPGGYLPLTKIYFIKLRIKCSSTGVETILPNVYECKVIKQRLK